MKVALLSDDTVLAEFIRRPLDPSGHVLSCYESVAALEESGDDPAAVIVPRRLRDSTPRQAVLALHGSEFCPAVILLGTSPRDRDLAADLDADGFLLLPFSDADVLDVIGASVGDKRVVLLADDSELIHRHTTPLLEEAGYHVVAAKDGAEALALVRSLKPDLLITDVEMPNLDGYQLCKLIKEDSNFAHIPVLIASTLGDAQNLERGFDCGADDYLVKPIVAEDLITRIDALFSRTAPASRESVLVVDDSPAQRHFVEDCLSRQGFAVSTAENGRIGLEKARAMRPELIVSDYEMPEMNGFELVHALRKDPELRNIPVVMLTARDSKRDMAQMRAVGASAYLIKPFAKDKCIATVERTLAERKLLDYKETTSVYLSEGARKAAEERVRTRNLTATRAVEREMSVLFSDIVGFTKMSAAMNPREVIDLLNAYFDVLCPIIQGQQGEIDKFIGDAVMAVFDTVRGQPSPAERATRAGAYMQQAIRQFNQGRTAPLVMRVGINTGPLVRGDLGSAVVRRDFTVIGDTVNRANRYETACPPGEVLISESTYAQVRDQVVARKLAGLTLKGLEAKTTGYVISAMRQRVER